MTKRTFENWDGSADEYIKEYFADRDAARAIKTKRMRIQKEFVRQDPNGDICWRHTHKGEAIMSINKTYTIEVYG